MDKKETGVNAQKEKRKLRIADKIKNYFRGGKTQADEEGLEEEMIFLWRLSGHFPDKDEFKNFLTENQNNQSDTQLGFKIRADKSGIDNGNDRF